MKIKIKYPLDKSHMRVENDVEIQEVFIKENILSSKGESIALGFNNEHSSGLIEMTSDEFDRLVKSVRNKIHLVKGIKVFKEFKENKEDEAVKALRKEAEEAKKAEEALFQIEQMVSSPPRPVKVRKVKRRVRRG